MWTDILFEERLRFYILIVSKGKVIPVRNYVFKPCAMKTMFSSVYIYTFAQVRC